MSGDHFFLDVRGFLCPQPLRRTLRYLKTLPDHARLMVCCDDPTAPMELQIASVRKGFVVLSDSDKGTYHEVLLKKTEGLK